MKHEARSPDALPDHPGTEFIERLPQLAHKLTAEVGRVIVGQDRVIDEILVTLLAGGHAILEGVPGLAKTLLVNTIASALCLRSGRIQFTPDLMPADITGTLIVQRDPQSNERSFVFRRGPIFVNIILADEINRSPPKTQAALLEGMAERQVTVAGSRHVLPRPFVVLATQNPIEQEGTYTLPEAQLDRFLLKIAVDYPDFDEEWEIVERCTGTDSPVLSEALSMAEVLTLQEVVRALPVSRHILQYATHIARRSRPEDDTAPDWVRQYISWGAGPRASQALVVAAKARTLLHGRFAVRRSDVRAVALPVLRHRLSPNFRAEGDGLTADDLVHRLVEGTSPLATSSDYDSSTRRILRL